MANGLLLLCVNPTGIVDAAFSPIAEHSALLVADSGLGTLGGSTVWVLAADGYCTNTNSFAGYVTAASAPAYTTRRKYELWGKVADVALTNGEGARIVFNANADLTDYWYAILAWNTAGGHFRLSLARVTTSVYTEVASTTFTTALDLPSLFHMIVYEQGDALVLQAAMFETDVVTDDEVISCAYTVVDRPHKTNTRFILGFESDPESDWMIRGCRISDMN